MRRVENEASAGQEVVDPTGNGSDENSDSNGKARSGDGGSMYHAKALREWNMKGAVARAKGRARVFLRKLWYDPRSDAIDATTVVLDTHVKSVKALGQNRRWSSMR